MKKRKAGNSKNGNNGRFTDEYTQEFDDLEYTEEYEEAAEYDGQEEYYEYTDAEEYEFEDIEDNTSGYENYEDEYMDEDDEYIVEYHSHEFQPDVHNIVSESEEAESELEDYEQALYSEASLAMELREEVFADENAYMEIPEDGTYPREQYGETVNLSYEDDAEYSSDIYYEDEYYASEDYAEDTESYYENDDYYSEDEEYYESEDYSDECYEDEDSFDIAYGDINRFYERKQESVSDATLSGRRFVNTLLNKIKHMSAFDAILVVTGVVVLVASVIIFSMYRDANYVQEQIAAIAPIGDELINVGVIGEEGLLAMTDAALMGNFIPSIEETSAVTETESEEKRVNVSFVSVERDLKIKFTDANTGELITGTMFEVKLTDSKGNIDTLRDEDMDGIIYVKDINAGTFDAIITSTDKYKFPTVAQQVKVKDKVEYVVINVEDEVKSESEVNVSAEDTQKQDAEAEAQVLTDTVEWVESSKTLIPGSEGYLLVDKNTITDPSQVSKAASRMLFDKLKVELNNTKLSVCVGTTAALTGTSFTDSKEGDVEYRYTAQWTSSNEGVATVNNGSVSAISEGTAIITYTVTKKTITTTYEPEVPVEETLEISISEYDALETAEKEKCTPIKDDADQTIGYIYKKVIQPQAVTNETTETASAECQVTVKNAGIVSAALELVKSAEGCKVGENLTVSPSKLVYNMEDGTVDTLTQGFPAIQWSSDKNDVAKVDEKGIVTGVKAGTATITARIRDVSGADGKKLDIKASVTVTIADVAQLSVALDKTDGVRLNAGETVTLVATVAGYKADSGVKWSTSDEKVAVVNEKGVVTGVAAGSAKITATANEKNSAGEAVTAVCTVTVNGGNSTDTTTKLKDKSGNQIYIKNADGKYREAVYADYYTVNEFYIQTEGQYKYTGWQTINGKTYYYDKNGNFVTGAQVIKGVTYNFGSDGAIATKVNGSTFGIDISRHNGNIDWNAVKASGVDYVILRCGYRGSATGVLIEDESFKKNIKGATAAGLKVGVYVFSQAINEVEAVKEASLAVSLVKGYNLTYPIFIDTESSGGRGDKIDVATRTAVVNAFCRTVASAGYQPGIYASKTWFEDKLNMGAIGNYKIWLAQYSAAPTYKGRYDMWQYTSKGKISGIKGDVDLNWSYLGY